MGLQGFFARFRVGGRPSVESLEDLTATPIAGGRHGQKFILDCELMIQEIQKSKQGIFSRRLGRTVDQLCANASLVLESVRSNPDGISNVRDFLPVLERVKKVLTQLGAQEVSFSDQRQKEVRETDEMLRQVSKGFVQMGQDVLAESRINLSVLNDSLNTFIKVQLDRAEMGKPEGAASPEQ